MAIGRLGLGVLGLACIAAAGTGGYLAVRHSAGPQTVAAAEPAAPAVTTPTGASAVVTESEGVVTDVPADEPATDAGRTTVRETTAGRTTRPSARRPAPPSPPRNASRPTPVPREAPPVAEASAPVEAPVSTEPAIDERASDEAVVASNTTTPDVVETPENSGEVEQPRKTYDDLVVPADSVLGLQIESTITSERAKVEDSVNARVTRDVRVGDHVAIPAGARVVGSVTEVDRGGKVKEKARLGIRFHTLVLADGTQTSIRTDTVYRQGASPAGESTAKIGGGAVAGAIIGAILGGGKGAAIGGAAGAGAGTTAVMAGGRNAATVQAGSTMTVRIVEPVTVTVERNEEPE